MYKINTTNNYLKIGIVNLLKEMRICSDELIVADLTMNFHMYNNKPNKKVIFVSDVKQQKIIQHIMSNINCIVLSDKCSLKEWKQALNNLFNNRYLVFRDIKLSKHERFLLPYFFSVSNMQDLSVITGVSRKSLYNTRSRVCQKLGVDNSRVLMTMPETLKSLI